MVEVEAEEERGTLGAESKRAPAAGCRIGVGEPAMDPAAGQPLDQVGGTLGGERHAFGVDPALEPLRRLTAQPDRAGRRADRISGERGDLEEEAVRLGADLAPFPAHHPGDGEAAPSVGDHQDVLG